MQRGQPLRAAAGLCVLAMALLAGGCSDDLGLSGYDFACDAQRPCAAGFTCTQGVCVRPGTTPDITAPDSDTGCTPACAGKTCGPDGCGGTCGTCRSGEQCTDGQCAGHPVCGRITFQGCCEGNIVVWCENDALQQLNCETKYGAGTPCGWVAAQQFYYCQGSGEDPSATIPIQCQYPQ